MDMSNVFSCLIIGEKERFMIYPAGLTQSAVEGYTDEWTFAAE